MKYLLILLIFAQSAFAAEQVNIFIYGHGLFLKKVPSINVTKFGHLLVKKDDIYSVLVNDTYHIEVGLDRSKKSTKFLMSNCSEQMSENYCLIKTDFHSLKVQEISSELMSFVKESLNSEFQNMQEFRMSWIEREKEKSQKLLDQNKFFATKKFVGFNENASYEANLWAMTDESSCNLMKNTTSKKVYNCEVIKDHTGYEIVFEKNTDKTHISNLHEKSIWYKPTKELLPYVDKSRWKKIGLTKKQYGNLHMFQNKPYKCITQLTKKSGSTYCVTTFQNNPSLGHVSIQYITQLNPTSEIIHIKAYTMNKFKAAPLFKGARRVMDSLRLIPNETVINRIPASD